ncbi:MAG: trypsin-like serine protease [Pseudomonadota bacterium]
MMLVLCRMCSLYCNITSQGDSGGPVMAKDFKGHHYLVGVVSKKEPNAVTELIDGRKPCFNAADTYVNVAKFNNWIKKTMKEN